MFEVFRNYLSTRISVLEDEHIFIESLCVLKRLKKHQYLLNAGDMWNQHAFVCTGLLRKFSLDNKGNEHTVYFAPENWWIGDRESLMNRMPSKYNIDTIEDAVVLLISEDNLQKIFKRIPPFKDMVNGILQKSLNVAHERINTTLAATAEEKYLNFLRVSPHLSNRIPLHMLASYLGITPETLSRVRKQITVK